MNTEKVRSLQDIMRLRGIDVDAIRYQKDKEEKGCVIRALESAFQVQATEEETKERLEVIRCKEQQYDDALYSGIPGLAKETFISLVMDDEKDIKKYYEDIAEHTTPLGQAMRGYKLSVVRQTDIQIREAVSAGKKVLMQVSIQDKGSHMLHVGESPDGGFMSLSDNGRIRLRSDTGYTCFIFEKN